jgi:hypothetical protein
MNLLIILLLSAERVLALVEKPIDNSNLKADKLLSESFRQMSKVILDNKIGKSQSISDSIEIQDPYTFEVKRQNSSLGNVSLEAESTSGHLSKHTPKQTSTLKTVKNRNSRTLADQKHTEINSAGKIVTEEDRNAPTCNTILIEALGMNEVTQIKSEGINESKSSVTNTYCFKNKLLCCPDDAIKKTREFFEKAQKKLSTNINIIRATFDLFRGNLALATLFRYQRNEECRSNLIESIKSEDQSDFFDIKRIQNSLDEIETLFLMIHTFKKQQEKFYANLICTACNAYDTKFFQYLNQKLTISIDMRTCSEILTWANFEMRLMKLYSTFLIPLAKLVECTQTADDLGLEIDEGFDEQWRSMESLTNNCADNFSADEEDCLKICSKSIYQYEFPGNLFRISKKVLRILYKGLTNMDIAKYINNRFNGDETWNEEDDTNVDFFDSQNPVFKKYKLNSVSFKLEDQGANINYNNMKKDYFESKFQAITTLRKLVLLLIFSFLY